MNTERLRTPEEAARWLDEQGLSKADVGRKFGTSGNLVGAILRGEKKAKRGASHNIAVFLGMKRGVATATKQGRRAA